MICWTRRAIFIVCIMFLNKYGIEPSGCIDALNIDIFFKAI
ncbi:hypothetical protein PP176A_1000 [Sporanaerobacter sp. PP17-6a]|nr:hypothetical protein PP176A_1000 [Sporanaerobacter sp. PP17-6a]